MTLIFTVLAAGGAPARCAVRGEVWRYRYKSVVGYFKTLYQHCAARRNFSSNFPPSDKNIPLGTEVLNYSTAFAFILRIMCRHVS